MTLLIEKGVITEEEFCRAVVRAGAQVDQLVAATQEQVEAEFDMAHPGMRAFIRKLMGAE